MRTFERLIRDERERLTWAQIRERYPDQWVVMVEHDWEEPATTYNTARVLACGASRAEAMAHARPALDAHRSDGCRYTGTIRGPMFLPLARRRSPAGGDRLE